MTSRAVGRTFARLHVVQIDSVNVLSRSHYLPFFSRLGNYDRSILHAMAGRSPRRMMEYWAHEASFIRPEHFQDLLLWQNRAWVGAAHLEHGLREDMANRILDTLATGRPMTAAQLTAHLGHQEDRQHDNWGWNWNLVKRVLEHLFEEGLVTAASRTEQFERRYTLTSRVLPSGLPAVIPRAGALPDGGSELSTAAMDRLIDAAAQAHGIGSIRCFADYFRTPVKAAAASIDRLVAAGRLEPSRCVVGTGPCTGTRRPVFPGPPRAVPCSARLIHWSLSVEGSRSCSASITGSRSTRLRRNASSGITCCPSSFGTQWSRA
ncbi:uncharacterized protein YcaQ [Arthrobacter sp. Hiyo8]|nr:uncharacterized protein YcaQ [Arthrobacter sp. Hiyo8]